MNQEPKIEMPTKKKNIEAKSTQKRKNLKDLPLSSKGLHIRGGSWSRDNSSVPAPIKP